MISRINRKICFWIDKIAYNNVLSWRAGYSNGRFANYAQSPLSNQEKEAIRNIWGKYGGNYRAFGFYKQFCGVFNPNYVPGDYYEFAERVLNLGWASLFLQHKCNLKYIIPSENRAKVILQKIDGHIVYEDNTEINIEEAIACLKKYPVFMAKRARGTGGGKGVQKIVLKEHSDLDSFLRDLLAPIDIEFEEVIQQGEFLAQFNPDSVNTLRFVTLNINEKCTLLSTFFRMGGKGSVVDNLSGGHGVLVGVDKDGKINDFGVNHKFDEKIYESPTGIKFAGMKIPEFDRVKQQIIDFHKKIPFANLIGWDVTIDKEGNPIVIEVNLDSAWVEAHQVFNGPIFGERQEEVMDYIAKRKPSLRHHMIIF